MLITLEIDKESLKFSAAHFTIFSKTQRERLHGHNFSVRAKVVAPVGDNGMMFNYKIIKNKLKAICASLDEYVLLPEKSPYLTIRKKSKYLQVNFNGEDIPFLEKDVLLLPIKNTTVEEYSRYILSLLLDDQEFVEEHAIKELTVGVSSGFGQWGSCTWVL